MTGSKMFSFRVQSPAVIELLDGLADKSSFIRDAVSEKFLAHVATAVDHSRTGAALAL